MLLLALMPVANLNSDYTFRAEFPNHPFGNALKTAAQVIASKAGFAALLAAAGAFAAAPTPPAQPASGPGGADYRHRDVAASYGTGATQFWLFDALTDAAFYGKTRE
jgi:hypothetical protein